MRLVAIVALALAASGCALNGILEVEMTLPYDGVDDRPYAIVQVDDAPPDPWYGQWDHRPRYAFQIDGTRENLCADVDRDCNVRFSVDSQNTSLSRMYLKISFCDDADCQGRPRDGNPPFYAFVIEHPFYQGCTTTWYADRPPVPVPALAAQPEPTAGDPPVTQTIERCEVGRFGDEGDGTAGWCVSTTGRHFCEER